MPGLAAAALPAIIVLSALGALSVCLLVARYGLPTGDESPEAAPRRLLVIRLGHALAAVCFAAVAMLAVVALRARIPPGPAAPATADGVASGEVARLTDELRRLEARVSRHLTALEERVSRAEVPAVAPAGAAAAPPPASQAAAASSAAPARPLALPEAGDDEPPATRPPDALAHHIQATVHGVRVDVRAGADPTGSTLFVVRLAEAAGRPLAGAHVSLHGWLAGGGPVGLALRPGREPGVYHGRVKTGSAGLEELRLRVAAREKRFELSLAQGVSW